MAPKPIPTRPDSAQASPSLEPTRFGSPGPSIPQIPLPASHTQTPTYGSPRNPSAFLSPAATGQSTPGGTLPTNASASALSSGFFAAAAAPSGEPLTEAQKAEIVRKHLLSADEQLRAAQEGAVSGSPGAGGGAGGIGSGFARAGGASYAAIAAGTASASASGVQSSSAVDEAEEYPTPYNTQGGDIVAPIYKWASAQASGQGTPATGAPGLRRSKSLLSVQDQSGRRSSMAESQRPTIGDSSIHSEGDDDANDSGMRVREILEPGGFRRDFVLRQRGASGAPSQNGRFTRSFVDFLSLYGHFGGEDLEEIDEEDEESEEDLEAGLTIPAYAGGSDEGAANERTPLVGRKKHSQRRSKGATDVGEHGDATVLQAVMMLLKSFVGTGVLFLGKAFFNGGILFSTITLCAIAMISLYSFLLLVETRLVVHGSFGDIGGILFGKYMRWLILSSIVLSQIGFVAAYTIFIGENLQAFFMAVTNCRTYIPMIQLILAQLVVFLPLAMIRNIQKLSGTALIADAFILFGLFYIFSNEISLIGREGIADVVLFNSKDFPLLIGTAVFSFEGIGLVIPITESMADPHKFPKVLTGVMVGVMVLFAGAGALAYAAFGSSIQTVVFVNLPQDDKFVNTSQFLYSIAILLSTPLQLFPAVRIMENGLFSRSGKYNHKVKWEKNLFRAGCVFACAAIAWAGAADLDKFVSLIGSVACVPLCFCYPAMLHYKACAHSRKQKVLDITLFVFGLLAAVYTTTQTVSVVTRNWQLAQLCVSWLTSVFFSLWRGSLRSRCWPRPRRQPRPRSGRARRGVERRCDEPGWGRDGVRARSGCSRVRETEAGGHVDRRPWTSVTSHICRVMHFIVPIDV